MDSKKGQRLLCVLTGMGDERTTASQNIEMSCSKIVLTKENMNEREI